MTYGSFGWSGNDYLGNIIQYKDGYIISGQSSQNKFDKGRNTGNINGQKGGGFLTYLLFWPESVEQTSDNRMSFTVYPNPATDYLYIDNHADKGLNIAITDVTGRTLHKGYMTNTKLDVRYWATGIYIINITDEDGNTYTRKVMKQ